MLQNRRDHAEECLLGRRFRVDSTKYVRNIVGDSGHAARALDAKCINCKDVRATCERTEGLKIAKDARIVLSVQGATRTKANRTNRNCGHVLVVHPSRSAMHHLDDVPTFHAPKSQTIRHA
jgi:hypothetical protein